MAFNIRDFSSTVNRSGGLATNNLFITTITNPSQPGFGNAFELEDARELSFLCRTVSLPGMELSTAEISPSGFGHKHRSPIGMQHGQLTTVFMVNSNFNTLSYFQKWMQAIINFDSEGGSFGDEYLMSYKDDYATTITVDVYGKQEASNAFRYTFSNAYPTSMGEIQLAWENQAEIMTLPVTFTYDYVTTSGLTGNRPFVGDDPRFGLGFDPFGGFV
jgi:hypothetical protein